MKTTLPEKLKNTFAEDAVTNLFERCEKGLDVQAVNRIRERLRMRTGRAGWIAVVAAACFFSPVLSYWPARAVPACPEPATVQQPDGQTIQVYLSGDEFLHWHQDSAGFTILQDGKTGSWVYAAKDATGNLVPSAAVVGKADPKQMGMPKRLLPDGAVARSSALREARQKVPSIQDGPIKLPRIGTMKNLVLLVQFSDKSGSRTKAEYEALFNTNGYTVDGAVGSVRDYYREVSYNALDVQSVVVDWITLDNGYAYYGANDAYGDDVRPREMVQEALAKLEARGFDFSTMDADNDGWVDGLTIIHAGGGEEYSGNDTSYIWSHKWSMSSTVTYDGKSLWEYHTEPERRGWDSTPSTQGITRIGVICHENGHFLGLPDLYDYGYDSKGAGDFCLMAGGSWNGNSGTQPAHMSAWCKKELTWLTPTVITASGTYSVPRVENNQTVYRLGGTFPSTQYFLVENRQGYGFDSSLPGSTRGLLIWHVDETQANNNDQTHYKVDLEEASGTQHLELNSNEGDDADYFRLGTMTTFDYGTTPNSRSYTGAALDQDITAVSASSATMTFTVSLPDDNNPSSFSATPISSSRIDLAWGKNPANDNVMVAWNTTPTFGTPSGTYSAGNAISGGGTVLYNGSATTASHTGLTAGTTCYYKAWSVLSGPAYSSGLTCSATTTHDLQLTEGFEHAGVIPGGWTQEYVTGVASWIFQNGGYASHPASAHGGSYNALLYYAASGDHKTKLVTSAINFGAATRNAQLTFWHTMEVWTPDQDELRVYYKTSAGGSWTLLATYTTSIAAWTQQTISLPNPNSTYYIGFEGNAKYGYGVCLDDMAITADLPVAPLSPRMSITLSGTNLVINCTNGSALGTYYVLASTNLAMPWTNWPAIATNSFDGIGCSRFTNWPGANVPRRFYRLQAVP